MNSPGIGYPDGLQLIKAAATVDGEPSQKAVSLLFGSVSKSGPCFACRDFFFILL